MGDRLTSVLRHLRHHGELYATLVVCGFVLCLKVFHHVEDQWVFASILATLMLLAISSIRDRAHEDALREKLDKIASNSKDDGALRWYTRRSDATTDMFDDMDRFPHIVFLGVSHRELGGYLRERLQCAASPLPWVTIEVYFASRVLGEEYEGLDFHRHLSAARQEIAGILTDPAHRRRLPHFRTVTFFQHDGFATHTGSLFGRSPQDLTVIYAVHSAVRHHGDTHQGLTMRLSAQPGLGPRDHRFSHYEGIYRALPHSAVRLGVFSRSIWDCSVEQWSEYARQSGVLARSAGIVASMLSPREGDTVLDIGSGSGDSARAILARHPGVKMILLDGSPQMIRLLHSRFHDEPRVRLALCHLSSHDGSSIDLGQEQFSYIIFHQCLGDLVRAFDSLQDLAMWCARRLRPNGRVVVSAHNTVVEADVPEIFKTWNDPFRSALARKLKRKRYERRENSARVIARAQVESAFKSQGFTLEGSCEQVVIELNYEERRRLWHVPAVMDSIVNASTVEASELARIVDEVIDSLKGQKTMPRTDVFWRFTLPAHTGVANPNAVHLTQEVPSETA